MSNFAVLFVIVAYLVIMTAFVVAAAGVIWCASVWVYRSVAGSVKEERGE